MIADEPGAAASIFAEQSQGVTATAAAVVILLFGGLVLVTDVREKAKPGEPTSKWYNAGIYCFRPSIFQFTAKLQPSPRGEYELTDAIRALAQSGKKVQAIELEGEWADVRDPEILARLNSL